MIPVNLILTIVGLLFLLIILVALYVWSSKNKASQPLISETSETFESLSQVIKTPSSSASELAYAVDTILSRFPKIGSHSIGSYKYLIEALCVHPKTDSKLILRFEKTLRSNNPPYAEEIERALAIGLAARG